MTDEERARGLMGLCVRARQAVFGTDGCLNAIRAGKAGLLLLDGGCSEATGGRFRDACAHHGVPLRVLREGLLEEAAGRSGVVMALPPGGFADSLLRLLQGENTSGIRAESAQEHTEKQCGGARAE